MNPLAQFMSGFRAAQKAPRATAVPALSQAERQHLVAQIRARQERLHALAEQARAVRYPPAANAPNEGSIALGDGSSLQPDPETNTWHFRANPDAEPVAVPGAESNCL